MIVLPQTSEPANFAAPAAPSARWLSQLPRAPALMLRLCSSASRYRAGIVMLEPIAVPTITAPAKFSALLANAPTPVVSNSK
ncbi:hypothetical protein [Burkholderia cenocepacia]|uniref:hypothetical protein n=1 Tax=Burkholderia cenocepacia TaxID=95486 RepID=UPI0020119F79|nr:hypothetical protein [Burkholderia cenocepacia]